MDEPIYNPDTAELKDVKIKIEYQYVSDEYYYYQRHVTDEDARHAYLFEVDWQQVDDYNKDELDQKSIRLANAKWGGMPNVTYAAEITYAGLWQVLPDGVISQVVWQTDNTGRPITKVMLNDFHDGIEGRPNVGERRIGGMRSDSFITQVI